MTQEKQTLPAINAKMDEKVEELRGQGVKLPAGYDPVSAIRSATFMLAETQMGKGDNRTLLEACSQASIVKSLAKMVIKGLNPAQNHCSFVAKSGQCVLQEQYQGKIQQAKRNAGLLKVNAHIVWNGDDFEWEVGTDGEIEIKHKGSLANITGEAKDMQGAYAVLHFRNGMQYKELMTKDQIMQSWSQGATKGKSPAHTGFADQMAKKTVISRALKQFVDSEEGGAELEQKAEEQVGRLKAQEEAPALDAQKVESAEEVAKRNDEIVKNQSTQQVDPDTGEIQSNGTG